MGLDQYAYRVKANGEPFEIAYWRKHNRLQGWMENLWVEKGKPNIQKHPDTGELIDEFNCVDMELTWEDIIDPSPKKGEVIVNIKAAALNFPDNLIVRGLYQFKPNFPFSPG